MAARATVCGSAMGISLEVIQTHSMEEEEEEETAEIPIPLPKESYLWPPYFTLTTPRNLCETDRSHLSTLERYSYCFLGTFPTNTVTWKVENEMAVLSIAC